MKIIASKKKGFILEATKNEVKDLLSATGVKDPDPKVEDTIPIANYIDAEKSAKGFIESRSFERAADYLSKVNKNFDKLTKVFEEEQ